MLVACSYQWHARSYLEAAGRGVEGADVDFSSIAGELLARALLAEPLLPLEHHLERIRKGPVAHRRPFFVPSVALEVACAAALCGDSVEPHLRAGVDALPAAQDDARTDREQQNLANWAVSLLAWLEEPVLLREWMARRYRMPPATAPVADTAVLLFGRRVAEREVVVPTPDGPAPMLAASALGMLSNEQLLIAATLLAEADHAGIELVPLLAEGRAFIDSDLWSSGDELRGRAKSGPLRWSATQRRLTARCEITATGGRLHAIAPFMHPAYAMVGDLDRFVSGEGKSSEIESVRSKKRLRELFADPDAQVVLQLETVGSAFIDPADVSRYEAVTAVVHQWLTIRHANAFAASLRLVTS